jgi:predicted transcriptional regulator of viral defense system
VRFIFSKPEHFFGWEPISRGEGHEVMVSDLSRTLLDGLRKPKYCAGLTEVAKAFFMAKDRLDLRQLIEYGHRLGELSVLRRLGFIVETLFPERASELEPLKENLPASAAVLEPDMPPRGTFDAKWGLRVNVSREALRAAIST